jgi:hypothetical protein
MTNIVRVIKSRRMRLVGHVRCTEKLRKETILENLKPKDKFLYRFVNMEELRSETRFEKTSKSLFEILIPKYGNNVRRYLKEIGCEGVNWICLAQGRVQW